MHLRLLADPVIRGRMMADSATRRVVTEMLPSMPAAERARVESALRADARAAAAARRTAPSRRRPRPSTPRPAPRPPADPHAGHDLPGPTPPPPPVDHSKMGHP
jgi:hypothetical protein